MLKIMFPLMRQDQNMERLGDFFRTLHASNRNTFVRIKTKVISCIASDLMNSSR